MSTGKIRVTGYAPADATNRPASAPSPQALDLLRFLALSTSVHADAVQSATDRTQSALQQMHSEEEGMNHLDQRLQGLLVEQRRLHGIWAAIARARDGRRHTDALMVEQRRRLEEERQRAQGKRAQSSRRGFGQPQQEGLKEADAAESIAGTEPTDVREERERQISAIDQRVDRLRRTIAEASAMAVRAKLLELETRKNAARDVDPRGIMRELMCPFRFPREVEEMWGAADASHGGASAATTPTKVGERGRSGTQKPSSSRAATVAVVDSTNVDLLIARATQRLTGRYKDALWLLTGSALDKGCRPQQAFGSLLYADYLESAEGNPDAAAVQALQSFGTATLADHYRRKCDTARVDAHIADRCFAAGSAGGAGDGARAPGSPPAKAATTSVLSAQHFCALPTNWAVTAALADVPADELLPPARHILTERFSFADAAELRAVEALRVEVQCRLIADLQDDAKLLDSLVYAARAARKAPAPSVKDRFVADARMAVTAVPLPGKSYAWPTVVSTAGDGKY